MQGTGELEALMQFTIGENRRCLLIVGEKQLENNFWKGRAIVAWNMIHHLQSQGYLKAFT